MSKGYIFNTDKIFYQHAINLYKSEDNLKILEKLIDNLSKLDTNKKIIFIMIPYSYQIEGDNCNQNDIAENKIVKTINKKNIKLIRLKEYFCTDNNKEKIFFKYDPAHLSNYGHELVAKILKQRLN